MPVDAVLYVPSSDPADNQVYPVSGIIVNGRAYLNTSQGVVADSVYYKGISTAVDYTDTWTITRDIVITGFSGCVGYSTYAAYAKIFVNSSLVLYACGGSADTFPVIITVPMKLSVGDVISVSLHNTAAVLNYVTILYSEV